MHDQAAIRRLRKMRDPAFDVRSITHVDMIDLYPERRGHRLDDAEQGGTGRCGGIAENGHSRHGWRN